MTTTDNPTDATTGVPAPLLPAPTTLLPGVTRRDVRQLRRAPAPAPGPLVGGAPAPAHGYGAPPARFAAPVAAATPTAPAPGYAAPPAPGTRFGGPSALAPGAPPAPVAGYGPPPTPSTRFGAAPPAFPPPATPPHPGYPPAHGGLPAPSSERTLSVWSLLAGVTAVLTLFLWFLFLPCGIFGAIAVAREKQTGTGTTLVGVAAVTVAIGARLCTRYFDAGSPLLL